MFNCLYVVVFNMIVDNWLVCYGICEGIDFIFSCLWMCVLKFNYLRDVLIILDENEKELIEEFC